MVEFSGKIFSIISGCYNFSNTGCPIFKQIIDMIYYNNNLTTQLLDHLTRFVLSSILQVYVHLCPNLVFNICLPLCEIVSPFSNMSNPLLTYFDLFDYPRYLFRRDVALVKFGIDRHKSDMFSCFLPVDQPIT